MTTDKEYLQYCRQLIEMKLGWTSLDEWRNYEFSELSDKIFETTNVQLSTTTLKRVFGKLKYENLPSSVTLNTLAQYLGFENWIQFKSSYTFPQPSTPLSRNSFISPRRKQIIRKVVMMGVFLTALLVSAFGFIVFSKPSTLDPQQAKEVLFNSRPLAEGLPNSVVFNVDLKEIRSNDILIQQSWDSTKTVRLVTGQKEATAIYYVPGYFRAKLIVDGNIIREHDLFIRSDEWMATLDHEPVPTYIKKTDLIVEKGLAVSSTVLEEIKKESKPLTLTYHLVRPFKDLHSDNFSIETSFKNEFNEGPAICATSKVFILCTNGAFIIPFTIPGCVSDVNLKLGDKTWPGKTNDLSAFGIDPTRSINLKLEVKNRLARIFLDGKLLREEKYEKDAGDVVGLRFSFLGAGSVENVLLRDGKENIVYKN